MIRVLSILTFLLFGLTSSGQNYSPKLNQKLGEINRPIDLVKEFETFGIKSPGSQEKTNTYHWLLQQYQSYGYDSITIDSFTQDGSIVRNIIVTKPGLTSEYIIVCGHYDTRNGPGASDNGSGVAAILETARLIKDLNTNRTVVFINFDREEDGFKGSSYHVFKHLGDTIDTNLYMVLNIDQIGGSKGEADNDKITCERDEDNNPSFNNQASWLITDTIASLCKMYTTLTPEISNAFLSDYIPFEKQGYVITGLYQSASDVFGHSPADTVGNMDTSSFKQAVRLSLASVIHFAQVDSYIGVPNQESLHFSIYPNPANSTIHIELKHQSTTVELMDNLGRVLKSVKASDLTMNINIVGISQGHYFVRVILSNGQILTQPVIVQ